ncbi:unnamed protein product [Phaedon cochleariae]|uniref:General transcription factor 3C polypeptide 5 n=1 Tax=Phaedon cochleariae TaxID=80249 RepID=A0A9P0DET5_PHACE|nr:unnamed protein product [Phaedon cochleariae]
MDDQEDELQINRFMVAQRIGNEKSNDKSKQCRPSNSQKKVDKNCLYDLPTDFIRIEYPGRVKNVYKAIESLGGMHGIEMAVSDSRNKLDIRFHPMNIYNKPCTGDRDTAPGILIKVIKRGDKLDYDIFGVTSLNYTFNKLCDFQYLPLVPNGTSRDDVTLIHNKIIPEKIADVEYFESEEAKTIPIFSLPTNFSRFEAQNNLYLNAVDKFSEEIPNRPYMFKMWAGKRPRKPHQKIFANTVNFHDPNMVIPEQPPLPAVELIEERGLEKELGLVKKLFDERPMWTNVAIQHKTGITNDKTKIILPFLAYFCTIGPWRSLWTKYGYNPLKDYNSRIYQTLDFRIRSKEGSTIKVTPKRAYATKRDFRSIESTENSEVPSKTKQLDERCYVLDPDHIPPARQMFYQYCDIRIPEIKEMLQRLPKYPSNPRFDPKNGWLPANFTEQCREIANRYVMKRVRKELAEDNKRLLQMQRNRDSEAGPSRESNPATYCSKMLSNIKKGIYKSVNLAGDLLEREEEQPSGTSESEQEPMIIEINSTEDSIYDSEDIIMEEVVASIPERMEENIDDDNLSQCSDIEIDLETVEEINQLIADTKKDLRS